MPRQINLTDVQPTNLTITIDRAGGGGLGEATRYSVDYILVDDAGNTYPGGNYVRETLTAQEQTALRTFVRGLLQTLRTRGGVG